MFLAAGFMRWKRAGEDKDYRAPLLLIPVKLERHAVQSGFKLLHHEDDVRFNATLLEGLKQDFKLEIPELEGELPRYESGIDVPEILQLMRTKVRDVSGFEVVEDIALSTFSFAKYLMWKDLVDRTDKLRKNRLVKHLIDNPTEAFVGDREHRITPDALDGLDPAEIMTPLPADSSQLAAVMDASNGRDFVLVGPPGTGKSQTISNIISQCLASGMTVLFVAEKAAALDVVHRRLVKHGLGDALLELHSNKTDRRSVIAQLGKCWDRTTNSGEKTWIQVSKDLMIERDKLNAYITAIHKKGTQGFSIFDAIGWIADAPDGIKITYNSMDAHDEESFRRLVQLVTDLGQIREVVRDRPKLTLVATVDWSHTWQSKFISATETLASSVEAVHRAMTDAFKQLGLSPENAGTQEHRTTLNVFAARTNTDALDVSEVPDLEPDTLQNHINAFVNDYKQLTDAHEVTAASYEEKEVARVPIESLDAAWREAKAKFWPFSALARRKTRKILQTYASDGTADPKRDLAVLSEIKARLEALNTNPLAQVAGSERDVARMRLLVEQAVNLRQSVAGASGDITNKEQFNKAVAELATTPEGELRAKLRTYQSAEENVVREMDAFKAAGGQIPEDTTLEALSNNLDTLKTNRTQIRDWTRWVDVKNRAQVAGLGTLIEELENNRLNEKPVMAFRRGYARWWLPFALDASKELREFAHWDHENIIKTFRELDDKSSTLAPDEVMRRIRHGLPARDTAPPNSELGTLRHQLGLQRPSMPIRKLLGNLTETFPNLAPCVLMSPLSIAQYLPAGQAAFDLVIFDEASQITTWDAVGAIARGRQTIIVGDPKQLPPTNFFGRTNDDEDTPELERDMPSILEEVRNAGIPTKQLNWHYRSRDEALIAFSNLRYYNGRLVTFPAPSTNSKALRFHKISGTYARGSGRVNQNEARAIVALIRQKLTEWLKLPEDERHTLGVITFNIQQQTHIQDLLDGERRNDDRLEWFFSDEREEPVIVKNLENIQGDERDVMIFSVTFGPDANRRLSMNFGALNNEGGEKRLNVAITRARREFHVFSSITADDIDLSRTRAVGVKDLKDFLNYAERGADALPMRDEGSLGPAESPFEEAVAEALQAKGWEVRTQVGVSGYRIDLGIVNPDRAGAYLAGIECDGAQYHSSATARDRDKIRQLALEGLGWNILRIWSTDWFHDSRTVIDRVHSQLEKLLEDDRRNMRDSHDVEEESANW